MASKNRDYVERFFGAHEGETVRNGYGLPKEKPKKKPRRGGSRR